MCLNSSSFSLMLLFLATIVMILEPVSTAQIPSANTAQTKSAISWFQPPGEWSAKMSLSENSAPGVSYFLCGFQFERTSVKWWDQNCDCKRRWFRWRRQWRCRGCNRTTNQIATSFKGVFCHYSNWRKQKDLTVDAQGVKSGLSNLTMCPQGQYAYAANGGLGNGFMGLQLRCSKIDLSAHSQISDNLGNAVWGQYSTADLGNFISSFQTKYEANFRLTGFQTYTSPAPIISNVEITYNISKEPSWAPTVVDSQLVSNNGQKIAQQTVSFDRKFQQTFQWKTSKSTVRTFQIKSHVSAKIPWFRAELNTSYYTSTSTNFAFDKKIINSWSSAQSVKVLVPPRTIVTISQVFYQSTLDIPFEARVTFSNKLTGQIISIETVNGVWSGVAVQKSQTVIQQKTITTIP